MDHKKTLLNNEFLITETLGRDADGLIMYARRAADNTPFLVKLVSIENENVSARLLHTLQLDAQRFSQFTHPNITPVLDPIMIEEGLLICEQAIPGEALSNLLRKNGRPLPMSEALQIADDISSTLAAMHSENLLCKNLDSSHVLILPSGEALLSYLAYPPNFGSEQALFRSPEAMAGKKADVQQDIYAMGVLLLQLFTNIPLISAQNNTQADETDTYLYYQTALNQDFGPHSERIVEIMRRCLTNQPSIRYPSAVELFWDIRRLSDNQRVSAKMPEQAPSRVKEDTFEEVLEEEVVLPRSEKIQRTRKETKIIPYAVLGSLALFLIAGLALIIRALAKPANEELLPNYAATLSQLNITQTFLAQEITEEVENRLNPTETFTATPLPAPTFSPTPAILEIKRNIGSVIRWNNDQSDMLFVPEGKFWMGTDDHFLFDLDYLLPLHEVNIDAFWIDQNEVTQSQYASCAGAGECMEIDPSLNTQSGPNLPAAGVSWADADRYCKWVGKRLPTEAEWEKAARGSDRRIYPWGNQSPDLSAEDNHTVPSLTEVGASAFDFSPYGLNDMGGNVSEWVNDFFAEDRMILPEMNNPGGPLEGTNHTIKGGYAGSENIERDSLLYRRRKSTPEEYAVYGFRCAVSDERVDEKSAVPSASSVRLAPKISYETTNEDCTNIVGFVADVTIPDGTEVQKGQWITKTWILKNLGTCVINPNYKVLWEDGEIVNEQKMFDFDTTILPNEEGEVSIRFQVQGEGRTRIGFMLADSNGKIFGLGERGIGELWVEYIAR